MKKLSLVISVLYGTALLHGCSTTRPEARQWTVEPVQRIEHATHRPDGYYQLGRYYQGQNRLDLAADAYRKALALDASFAEAHNALGTIHAARGRYNEAMAAFNAAVAAAPNAAHLYNNVGYLNLLLGRYGDAVAAFSRATALDPSNAKARNNLEIALARYGLPVKTAAAPERAASQPVPSAPEPRVVVVAAPREAVAPMPAPQAVPVTAPETVSVAAPANAPVPVKASVPVERVAARDSVDMPPAPRAEANPSPAFARVAAPNPHAVKVVIAQNPAVPAAEVRAVAPSARPGVKPSVEAPARVAAPQVKMPAVTAGAVVAVAAPRDRPFAVEVSNGNGVRGFAARIGALLADRGEPQARLTNQRPFNQAKTVIYYRKGYLFEAARLGRYLQAVHGQVAVVETRNPALRADVRVVLGRDLSGRAVRIADAGPVTVASR